MASMLIVEMASWYKQQGKSLVDALEELYQRFGYYQEQVANFQFEGAEGMAKMAQIMETMRQNPPAEIAGSRVVCRKDYKLSQSVDQQGRAEPIDLPKSNVLEYRLENGCTAIVRPSGTEPKIKLYLSLVGRTQQEAQQRGGPLKADMERLMGVG